jgi:hypothetical protein
MTEYFALLGLCLLILGVLYLAIHWCLKQIKNLEDQ